MSWEVWVVLIIGGFLIGFFIYKRIWGDCGPWL